MASLFRSHKSDYVYPNERIDDCWEKVLLNGCEFALPGAYLAEIEEFLARLLQSTMVSCESIR